MGFIGAIIIVGLIWLFALGWERIDEERENDKRKVQAVGNASKKDEEGEQNQYDSPNSAFGITRDDQVSRFSSKKIDLHFAEHEIVPPKPHSALVKYYANVWKMIINL